MTKVSVLTLMIMLKGILTLELDKEQGGRVKRQWGERMRWCVRVFIIVVLLAIVRRGRCLGGCCSRGPPLYPPLQRFVFSSPGNSGERVEEKKGMIVLLGATGPLWTQPVLSLDLWPVLLWSFSFGEGRQLGELQEGWWTAGPIWGERETERRVRAWEREGCKRDRGISVWGKEEKRKEKGRAGAVTKVLSAPVCQPWHMTEALLYTHTHTQICGLWESFES